MILALILTLLFGGCSAKGDHYVIEGQTELTKGYYYLFDEQQVVDSAEVVGGRYRFEGEVDKANPVRNIASTDLSNPLLSTRFAQVILEGGGVIKVTENDQSRTGGLVVRGTKGNEAMYDFTTKGTMLHNRIRATKDREERSKLFEQYERLVEKTITRNSDNYAGVMMLIASHTRYSVEQRKAFIEGFSKTMQQTTAVQNMRRELNMDSSVDKMDKEILDKEVLTE